MNDRPGPQTRVHVRRAKPLLGTLVEIDVEADSADAAHRAIDAAFAEIAAIDRLMSFHRTDSDLSRLNRAAPGEAVRVDARTAEVLDAASAYARESGGAFDVGVGGLLVLRGCLPAIPGAPAQASHAPRPGAVVVLRGPCVIDLGGIAKGYAVDRAIDVLAACGVASAGVNAGGDLRHVGDGSMEIHVRDPADPAFVLKRVSLRQGALASSATSGLEAGAAVGRRAEDASARHCALMDVRTATPLAPDGGATVVAPTCMLADALTKVVLVSGTALHPMLGAHGAQVVLYRAPGATGRRTPA